MKQHWMGFALILGVGLSACAKKQPNIVGGNSSIMVGGTAGSGAASGTSGLATDVAYFQNTIGDTVLFSVNQSDLRASAITILAKQAMWLVQHPTAPITIEGHADEQGTREYNVALGARRASAVKQYFVSQGVASNRIDTVSFGKERPLKVCSEESCWRKNRRAVTLVTNKFSG